MAGMTHKTGQTLNGMPQRGFTLAEVLLAVVIIGLIAAPMVFLFTTSLRTSKTSQTNLEALFLAQYVMEKIKHGLTVDSSPYQIKFDDLGGIAVELASLVEPPPTAIEVMAAPVHDHSTMAVAVANTDYAFTTGIPPNACRFFRKIEDMNKDGDFEGGITPVVPSYLTDPSDKANYKQLYGILSRYYCSINVEDYIEPDFDPAPLKKITVRIQWKDLSQSEAGKTAVRKIELYAIQGEHVPNN